MFDTVVDYVLFNKNNIDTVDSATHMHFLFFKIVPFNLLTNPANGVPPHVTPQYYFRF